MKKIFVLSFMVLTSLLMVKCSTSKKATTSEASAKSMTPSETVAALKSQYSEDQMQQGKTIFETKCHKCHGLKQPATHTFSKFEKVLPAMIKKAKLNEQDGNLVRAYLLTNAKQS